MLRKLLILGLCAGSSASVPMLYQAHPQAFERLLDLAMSRPAARDVAPPMPVSAVREATQQPLGRKVLLQADARGHFVASFKVNGRPVEAMVDTGATVVALNRSTASRAGISLSPSDFDREVDTANGKVKAAVVEIASLQIGRIAVDHVPAVVLDDKALATTLIGMSFLRRLDKFQVQDGKLLLAQ
ncbi:TIGR02281 family clan AA aspartic protease [Ollibium composti]|uniref:TIGR02281 family clan AA aspartic protease n=1 Tax=Ollibium composti TaxID=2675109 RepID=A0ABY2Q8B8_9HYPH|nr:TIGR02281 family clan AA aspartic protease [Mesorhizobium composti]THF57981.1 TIGR02281 family clan AA aspartic protease [Mesorhizobium composti]